MFLFPPKLRRLPPALLAALLLAGCASAPKAPREGFSTLRTLETVRDEPHARIARFLDAEVVLAAQSVSPPRFLVAEGAAGEGIDASRAVLVANRAARDLCTGLAPYFRITETDPELELALYVTAIEPTSPGAAGVSELIGVFVPGPFRLPAGLGGFAADGVARRSGEDLFVLRWAEGANPVTEGARVSRIGDAYQLAGDFADDFAEALNDPQGRGAEGRARLDAVTIEANRALCLARFGRTSVAGQGASILLPLAPEAIDPGPPEAGPEPLEPGSPESPEPSPATGAPSTDQRGALQVLKPNRA